MKAAVSAMTSHRVDTLGVASNGAEQLAEIAYQLAPRSMVQTQTLQDRWSVLRGLAPFTRSDLTCGPIQQFETTRSIRLFCGFDPGCWIFLGMAVVSDGLH
jgi:hypothetical protein